MDGEKTIQSQHDLDTREFSPASRSHPRWALSGQDRRVGADRPLFCDKPEGLSHDKFSPFPSRGSVGSNRAAVNHLLFFQGCGRRRVRFSSDLRWAYPARSMHARCTYIIWLCHLVMNLHISILINLQPGPNRKACARNA